MTGEEAHQTAEALATIANIGIEGLVLYVLIAFAGLVLFMGYLTWYFISLNNTRTTAHANNVKLIAQAVAKADLLENNLVEVNKRLGKLEELHRNCVKDLAACKEKLRFLNEQKEN